MTKASDRQKTIWPDTHTRSNTAMKQQQNTTDTHTLLSSMTVTGTCSHLVQGKTPLGVVMHNQAVTDADVGPEIQHVMTQHQRRLCIVKQACGGCCCCCFGVGACFGGLQ